MDENNKNHRQKETPSTETAVFTARKEREAQPSYQKQEPLKPSGGGQKKKPIRKQVYHAGKLKALIYVGAVLVICVVLSSFALNAITDMLAISKPDTAISVTIPANATSAEVGEILEEAGLIRYGWLFGYISDYEGYDGNYQFGTHVLNTNMGYTTMMKEMEISDSVRETVTVTIPEGYCIGQIAALLEENGVCEESEFLKAVNSTNYGFSFEDSIPDDDGIFYRLEGYIFPDTYEFYKGDSALNVIKRFLQTFEDKVLTPETVAAINQSGYTLHEVITLASIIQGEAPNVEEMLRVSSVYHNRLDDKLNFPKLQADPTRDYANEQILESSRDDADAIADAYDTYQSDGLPPGPINNPGVDAVNAALHPEDTNYYYFCTNLETQEFYYASTLEEHNQNVYKAGLRQSAFE